MKPEVGKIYKGIESSIVSALFFVTRIHGTRRQPEIEGALVQAAYTHPKAGLRIVSYYWASFDGTPFWELHHTQFVIWLRTQDVIVINNNRYVSTSRHMYEYLP